ncbi:hypothetical protein PSPO01_15344 [Paraphaeosphaeria sporulosa]
MMAPRLWIMTTFSDANINPLHRQRVNGREIVVTEEPKMHLAWIHNRIFVKPLPRYMLSHAFWKTFLEEGSDQAGYIQSDLYKAATGFLRTYHYLIQHESDFHMAQQDNLRLIPKDIEWSSFFLRKFHFEQVHGQYGDFFGRLYGPILFAFAVVSTILNSMQVALAADQLEASHWEAVWHVSRFFSTVSLVAAACVSSWFILLWLWMFLDEWMYTIRQKLTKKREAQSTLC